MLCADVQAAGHEDGHAGRVDVHRAEQSGASEKSTVPSAEPVGAGVTAAVKVTAAPTVAGFGDAVSVVVVVTNWPVPERFTIGSPTPTDPVREPGCVGVKTTESGNCRRG